MTESHGSLFRCVSQYATSGLITVTVGDMIADTYTVGVEPVDSSQYLFALAAVYVAPVGRP